jgi:hypothetical protein
VNQTVKIEKFNRLMQSQNQPNPLLAVLRQLSSGPKKESRNPKPLGSWSGWSH